MRRTSEALRASRVGRVARCVAPALLAGLSTIPPSRGVMAQRCGHEPADSLAVLERAEGIIAADNARDIERVLDHYGPDALLMPPGESIVRDRVDIRRRYTTLFEQYDPAIVAEIDRVDICGDLAVVSGRNQGWLRGRGGRPDRPLHDVYVMLLRLESERWRIIRLIWHSERSDGDGS